eukprot:TRINITY_DN45882_c0_g1_i1.p1 TRINITY_DN45882_c0_g1~~TRINITY_DN45882_c0_g1_i1.p1  ORF type:complete len:205 (-),score=76.29 TRINITY_DN45882_c0_g1_i1:437-1051(-)
MADIKLTYFNGRGRAETARLVLAYAGAKYEDERITGEQLAALKSTLAYGQLPKLEFKGEALYQSVSIARFLAREFGIAGSSNLERAQSDEVVDAITDIQNAIYGALFEKDDAIKEEKMKKVSGETIPSSLANLEKNLVKRGGQFFVGNSFTWAELHLLQLVDILVGMKNEKALEATPKLANLMARTKQIPNIKQYLEDRPASEF